MMSKTDSEKLNQFAEEAIDEYFENIDSVVDKITYKIIESKGIKEDEIDESDLSYLKTKVMRGILKLD